MALSPAQIQTWVSEFNYDESIKRDVQRKYLAHYVNVATGETASTTPEWEILGYKVEDASIEFNWEEETTTDILGATYRTITRSQPEISLDGYIVNTQSKFLKQMADMAIRNAYDEFSNFEILTVYYWLSKGSESSKTYLAKKETECTIQPDSMGGEGYVRISPVISLSNKATFGSVAEALGTAPTFTEGSI